MTKILYVEDELFLGRIVSESLTKAGFDVYWEKDGAHVEVWLEKNSPDICVLDIMLPNIDGYTLCRKISAERPGLPIIFLTAKTETKDILKGFEAGGTDYIRKPFSMDELVVRINNQLKLSGNKVQGNLADKEIPIGRYVLHTGRYELSGPDGIVKMSQRDMQVLGHLLANMNGITDRRQLLNDVWGDDSFFNSRNLDVYIRKIREYFRSDSSIVIKTLKGKGYIFIAPRQ